MPKRFLIASVSLGLLLFVTPPCGAQGIKAVLESLAGGAKPEVPEPTMSEQLDWARAQLSEARWDEKSEKGIQERLFQAGLPASRIDDFRVAAKDIERSYQGAVDLLPGLIAMKDPAAPAVAVPSSEEQAGSLREAVRRTTLAANGAEGEIEVLRKLVSQHQALGANAEREVRQLGEEAATAKSVEAKNRAALQLELASLQKRAADAISFFGKWKLYQQETTLKKALAEQEALRAALKAGGFDRQMDLRRVEKQLASVQAEGTAVDKEAKAAIKEQKRAIAEAAALKENTSAPDAKSRAAAADSLAVTAQGLVTVIQGSLSLIEMEKAHWLSVRNLAKEMSTAELQSAIKQAGESIQVLRGWRPGMDRRLIESRERADAAQRQLRTGAADPGVRSTVERTLAAEQKRGEVLGDPISRTEQVIALQEEFLAELRLALGGESAPLRIARAWSRLKDVGAAVWSFELFPAGANSITTRKAVLSVVGLLLTLSLAGAMSRWVAGTATRNFHLAVDQRALLEKCVFFPAAGILILTMLNWLSIPLTVFAFLGGALAIGLGFGVQNLMNNFISGIILLLERQIKVGDIIEVAGSTGKVAHLGSRCSRIRKFDGVEVLIPNSSFLEKEVTNWTLADPQHRFDFTVGVAYGSEVDKVIDLLSSAVGRQPEILREPAPGVFFEAFGESSLVFKICYWITLSPETDARQVGSELRCRIERDFRAAGIEMPFPQRDLHIRSTSAPLSVRIEKKS